MTSSREKTTSTGAPILQVKMPDRAAWRRWLELHHAASPGVWLQLEKERQDALTYTEAVQEALCFGWIDGKVRRIDATCYLRLFSPRKPNSDWSKLNKQRVEALKRRGLITAAGQAAINLAKANGSWTSLDAVEELRMPRDLAAALAADPKAQRNFASFPPSARKEYLYWVTSARRPSTRAERVQQVVALAARNLKSRHRSP